MINTANDNSPSYWLKQAILECQAMRLSVEESERAIMDILEETDRLIDEEFSKQLKVEKGWPEDE